MNKKLAEQCVELLKEYGADKASCIVKKTNMREINANDGKISLLRNVHDQSITLTAIKNKKEARSALNRDDLESIQKACLNTVSQSESAQADDAYDIWSEAITKHFEDGVLQMDEELALKRVQEFLKFVQENFPTIRLEEVILKHILIDHALSNSEGVNLSSVQGYYEFMAMFTAKEGKKASSFNYASGSLKDLNSKLIDCFNLKQSMLESTKQLDPMPISENFVGDVIVAPEVALEFSSFILSQTGVFPLLEKTSVYLNALNSKIADSKLTLVSNVLAQKNPHKSFYSADGNLLQNCTFVQNGVLKHYPLGLYGSRKLKEALAPNTGDALSIDKGDSSLELMIKNTKRGILLNRFSGGRPASNGDFSGVAKNSFMIEDGKITHALTESMIASNLKTMLANIAEISQEVIDYGQSSAPWVKFSGVNISGK